MEFEKLAAKFKIGLWGNWNTENLGDIWVLNNMKKRFPGIVSIDSKYTTSDDIEDLDFLIIGCGELFNGPKLPSLFREKVACKYGAFSVGGEFEILDKENLKQLVNESEFFTVRDTRNLQTFQIPDISEVNKDIGVSGDLSFLYPLAIKKTVSKINNIKLIWRNPTDLFSLEKSKFDRERNQDFKEYIGQIPFNSDKKTVEYLTKTLKVHGRVIYDNNRVKKDLSYNSFEKRFENSNLVVSSRYHGLAAAIQMGIPCIALDICPRINTLMKEAGLEKYCLKLYQITKIPKLLIDIEKTYHSIVSKMKTYRERQKERLEKYANITELYIFNALVPEYFIKSRSIKNNTNSPVKAFDFDSLNKEISETDSLEKIESEIESKNFDKTVINHIMFLKNNKLDRIRELKKLLDDLEIDEIITQQNVQSDARERALELAKKKAKTDEALRHKTIKEARSLMEKKLIEKEIKEIEILQQTDIVKEELEQFQEKDLFFDNSRKVSQRNIVQKERDVRKEALQKEIKKETQEDIKKRQAKEIKDILKKEKELQQEKEKLRLEKVKRFLALKRK